MAVFIFTYAPFEGEPDEATLAEAFYATQIEVTKVQPRTWLIRSDIDVEDLTGADTSALMDVISKLLGSSSASYAIAPIVSLGGRNFTGDSHAIGAMMTPSRYK